MMETVGLLDEIQELTVTTLTCTWVVRRNGDVNSRVFAKKRKPEVITKAQMNEVVTDLEYGSVNDVCDTGAESTVRLYFPAKE